MEETHKLDVRPLLVGLAVGFVAVAIWAATALGAGGSSSGDSASTGSTPFELIQTQDDGQDVAPEDCPERDSGSGGSGSGGSGSDSGSSSTSL